MNSFENFGGSSTETPIESIESQQQAVEPESRFSLFELIRKEIHEVWVEEEKKKEKDKKKEADAAKTEGTADGKTEETDSIEEGKKEPTVEEIAAMKEAQLFHSRWLKKTLDYFMQIKNYPSEVEEFWLDFDDKFADGTESEKGYAENYKQEILFQAAGQTLMEDYEELLKSKNIPVEVEIEPSSPKEDVEDMVDFWVHVKFEGKTGMREKTFACHVIGVYTAYGMREDQRKRGEVVKDNYLNFQCPDRKKLSLMNYNMRNEILDFFSKNFDSDPKIPKMAICLPIGNGKSIQENGKVIPKIDKDFKERTMDKKSALWEKFIP
jgi:hypothetical protein